MLKINLKNPKMHPPWPMNLPILKNRLWGLPSLPPAHRSLQDKLEVLLMLPMNQCPLVMPWFRNRQPTRRLRSRLSEAD